MRRVVNLSDQNTFVAIGRQVFGSILNVVDDTYVELRSPVTVGRAGDRVPVVVWQVIYEDGFFAWRCTSA